MQGSLICCRKLISQAEIFTGCVNGFVAHVIIRPHVVLLDLNVGYGIKEQLLWHPVL